MIINVNGYAVSPENISGGTEGSHNNEKICFAFDDMWDGLIKTVTFCTPKRDIVCLVPDGELMLPYEVTEQSGVTRYVICGTNGARTVVSAEGTITVGDTLTVSEEMVDRHTPGVLERITLFMKESEDAYAAAAQNATEAQQHASEASGYASSAHGYSLDAQSYASEAGSYATEAHRYSADAQGYASEAGGYASSANGYRTEAQSYASEASGYASNAHGYSSDAQSYATEASGYASNANGYRTEAQSYAAEAGSYAAEAYRYSSDAQGYAAEASGYSAAAQSAKAEALLSASAASDSADAAQISEQNAKSSEEKIRKCIQNGEYGIPVKMMDDFPNDAQLGALYVKPKRHGTFMKNYDKYIFVCPDGVLYRAWACENNTVLYTESENPQNGDTVYYAFTDYSVEATGSINAVGNVMRAYCTGDVNGIFTMTRDESHDLLSGSYSWEMIDEEKPMSRVDSITLASDSHHVSVISGAVSNGLLLSEFYLRVKYRTPTSKSGNTDLRIMINETDTGFSILGNSGDGATYLFRGVYLGDSLALYRIPDLTSVGSEACVIVDCSDGVSDISIVGASSNPLGKNTVIDLWGREEL